MSDLKKLEAHKKILETKREIAKKRSELCRRQTAIKYCYVTDEETIDANSNLVNSWITQLKLIEANKGELECCVAKADNYVISLDEFKNLVAMFERLTFLTSKLDAKADVRELLDQSSIFVEMQNLLTKDMRSHNEEFTSIMKFIAKCSK